MGEEIWVLGATGRTGRGVAARLIAAGQPVVLVGRSQERLTSLAEELGGATRTRAGSLAEVLAELNAGNPAVVVNTVGPFTTTAAQVANACPPGTHYVDLANEFGAIEAILNLDEKARTTDRTLVAGAGFGVLATESALIHLCEGRPTPVKVRVDAVASVATEVGVIGDALAHSILDGLPAGGGAVKNGCLTKNPVGGEPETLTTPDGDTVVTGSIPTGELLAAWRASKADDVVAASAMAPTGLVARLGIPLASLVFRVPAVARYATQRLARVPLKAKDKPWQHSWGHARAEWPDGTVTESWLRAGDGMDFTVGAATEVALRLARGEGRPGAYTPAALFGPELAIAAGGDFVPAP